MTGAELALIIGAFLTGASGLIAAYSTSRSSATKAQFDVLAETIKTVQGENQRLLTRIEHLEQELEERDGSLAQVQDWAELLVAQVRRLGGEPVPMPVRDPTRPRRGRAIPQ